MRFIELHVVNGTSITVNLDQVMFFYASGGETVITFKERSVRVTESYAEVSALVMKAE